MYGNTQHKVSQSPFANASNYRLTRAVWYALYAPDQGRHTALEAGDLPDPYRTLFDAILEGNRGLARVYLAGGEAAVLLDTVARLPRPRGIPTRRLDLPETPDLAAALFGRVADDLDLSGVGSGTWPGVPSHTCAAKQATGTVLTIRARRTSAARMFNPTWRTCPACLYQRAKRIARQTLITMAAIGPMTYATLTAADYRRWTARTRQHKARGGVAVHYRALPQAGGDVFLMATAGLAGAAVPTDRGLLHALIMAHANTPDGHNTSSNRGYGGDYKRMKGDGRDDGGPAVQRWTDSALEDVAAALDVAGVKPHTERIYVQIDQDDAIEKLVLGGIALRLRRSVTHSSQSSPPPTQNCTKSVTDDPPDPPDLTLCPLPYPAEDVTGAEEVAEWPTYSA